VDFQNPHPIEPLLDLVWHHGVCRPVYRRYARGLGLRGDEQVLEVGSGSGALTRHLAERLLRGGGRVTCVDTSKPWSDVARRRLHVYPNVTFKVGELAGAGLAEGTFDAVVMHFMLHEVKPDKRQSLVSAAARALRVGGRFFIKEPTREKHGMPVGEIRRLMTNSRLTELSFVEVKPFLGEPLAAGVFEKPSR